MVIYEAARAICSLPGVDAQDLAPAITCLQLLLSSPKPAVKLAAVRTLSAVSQANPLAVSKCNEEMESLISDGNRSIATLGKLSSLPSQISSPTKRNFLLTEPRQRSLPS